MACLKSLTMLSGCSIMVSSLFCFLLTIDNKSMSYPISVEGPLKCKFGVGMWMLWGERKCRHRRQFTGRQILGRFCSGILIAAWEIPNQIQHVSPFTWRKENIFNRVSVILQGPTFNNLAYIPLFSLLKIRLAYTVLSPFHWWENWGSEIFSVLAEATHLVNGIIRVETQDILWQLQMMPPRLTKSFGCFFHQIV